MNVTNGLVSRQFLIDWARIHDMILTPQVRNVSHQHSGWITGFIQDILFRNKDLNEIPLKGGQILVVESMGDLPTNWAHWSLITDIKFQIDMISENGEDLNSHHALCDALISIFKNKPSQYAINRAKDVLGRYDIEDNSQTYDESSLEFKKCFCLINHLRSLSYFYWARKGASLDKVVDIQTFMLKNRFVLRSDLDFIFSQSKGKVSLWDRADKEIYPGALVKIINRQGEMGLVQTAPQYSPENLSPYFIAIVGGEIIHVNVDNYAPIKRRKKEKKIA